MWESIQINTSARNQFIDITSRVNKFVSGSGISEGVCYIFVPHTTAAVTINENADPTVSADILRTLEKLVPAAGDYAHLEGNSDAHIKSVLVGSSVSILINGGKLALGTWQGVFFCEFDGPRSRKLQIKVIPG